MFHLGIEFKLALGDIKNLVSMVYQAKAIECYYE